MWISWLQANRTSLPWRMQNNFSQRQTTCGAVGPQKPYTRRSIGNTANTISVVPTVVFLFIQDLFRSPQTSDTEGLSIARSPEEPIKIFVHFYIMFCTSIIYMSRAVNGSHYTIFDEMRDDVCTWYCWAMSCRNSQERSKVSQFTFVLRHGQPDVLLQIEITVPQPSPPLSMIGNKH